MEESSSREIALTGSETSTVLEALEHHESGATDATEAELDDLESRFDRDLDAGEAAEVELTRADAHVVLSALEEREPLTSGRDLEKLLALRGRFAEAFDFEDRVPDGAEPMEDERYPGGT
ncbi:hypothetical protein [Halorussus sp. MSC15.2]|uniref:hypothetical protein n=1 Tax=Halorussus sp. MSC15.2 TaxID=2283638 RepID=UPI0013D83142|nr:hypothetical protein [Halorussus sp. MSC15.2]NEU57511.1 hypothetical protein [Halorussus sp. MSC15.2]